jgi:hypothetical protein
VNGLLVRVGADQSPGGGSWNGPINTTTGEFTYVAIPEHRQIYAGLEKPFKVLEPFLSTFGVDLPIHLQSRHMHLDPDFARLTYGDQGERAKQLQAGLKRGDLIVFYAGLANTSSAPGLVYALIGLFVVDRLLLAADVAPDDRDLNAHSRRVLAKDAKDIIVCGEMNRSGRLKQCIPVGEYRDRAYRVRRDLLESWGGLSVKDGYLQRSARLPRFLDTARFLRWFESQQPSLMQTNN